MSEKPILFNGEMVRAVLEGRKTQTRRIMVPADMPDDIDLRDAIPEKRNRYEFLQLANGDEFGPVGHRYGRPGDLLWVRETHFLVGTGAVYYRADGHELPPDWSWRPSIFMPRWASRITLRVTDVRVERVQDISEADAVAEGVCLDTWKFHQKKVPSIQLGLAAIQEFAQIWNIINAKRSYGWDVNPWVWAVTFEVAK